MVKGRMIDRPRGLGGKVLVLLVGLVLLWASAAQADMFLKFADITGDSTVKGFVGWTQISHINWGVSNSQIVSGGGGGAGKANFQDLSWTQALDKTFPTLFLDVATGKHIKEAFVDFTKPGRSATLPYFEMHFRDVLLANLIFSSSGNEIPTVNGAFNYGFIEITYWVTNLDGSRGQKITESFDLIKNKGGAAELALLYAMGITESMLGNSLLQGSVGAPIPGSVWLLGAGLAGLAGWRMRRG
jgi:type VI secretion system secreted protein Hcp